MTIRQCWCGNNQLTDFSDDYRLCSQCQTLVWKGSKAGAGDLSFYDRNYFFEHQSDLGNPDLISRARTDLADRCLYWLRALLKYQLPPADVLEIGSSHGAFVGLLNTCGYQATGLDLDAWIVEFSRRTFGIQALSGSIEEQTIPNGSLDVVLLMDVLEHLPDPLFTMQAISTLLKSYGTLMIQTPCYPEGQSLSQLERANHPFLKMMLPREHIYLFSQTAIRILLNKIQLDEIVFEPALYSGQDMFVFTSRRPLQKLSVSQSENALLSTPSGRLAQALLDLYNGLEEANVDREARLSQIIELTGMVKRSEEKLNWRPVRWLLKLFGKL